MSLPTPPLLQLHEATVVRDGRPILDRISLAIAEGEHTAIIGPNGSGKSTLIALLTLQVYPLAGDGPPPVRLMGLDRWNVFDLRSRLGIVTADLHQRFVSGNVAGRIRGIDAVLSGFFASQGIWAHQAIDAEMRLRAAEVLELMDASHLAGKTLDTMSTGEARRVLIARALVTRPRALVLDEPTTGLDFVARARFLAAIREVARSGVTLILVTHHVEEVVPEIERVILLEAGRVALDGAKAQVLSEANLSRVYGAGVRLRTVDGHYEVGLEAGPH